MTNIGACSQDNLPYRWFRMPVHLARFHRPFCRGGTETWFTSHVFTDLSITVVPNSGPPRMVSLHFCAGGRSICPLRTVFQVHRSGWSGKDSHLARFSPTFLPRGDGNLLHLAWFRCISVLGGRSAGLPRTFFLWFLARWSRMPVHPAHFCTLLHAFAHFSAFYPKRGLLFLVNYRSLLAFREETF